MQVPLPHQGFPHQPLRQVQPQHLLQLQQRQLQQQFFIFIQTGKTDFKQLENNFF